MGLKLIFVLVLLFNFNYVISSLDCPVGYIYSPTNGCLNGTATQIIISSGLCVPVNVVNVLRFNYTTENPCSWAIAFPLDSSSTIIQYNSFQLKHCVNGQLTYIQVGDCGKGTQISSETIQFINPNRFLVGFTCVRGLNQFEYSAELSDTPNYSSKVYDACISTSGSMTGYSVYEYPQNICQIGFEGTPPNCNDINECNVNNGGCSEICNNVDGSFSCSCSVGSEINFDGKTCYINCDDSNGGCGQICNPSGVNSYCSCQQGYALNPIDKKSCIDINECNLNNGGCNQICNNIDGGFSCLCLQGYTLNPLDQKNCIDINECDVNNGGCSEICNNIDGSFSCSCNVGSEINTDGKTCHLNCDDSNGGCDQICNPSGVNSYCSCQQGYVLNPIDKSCNDVNECITADICPIDTTCINHEGSYTCEFGHIISSIIPSTTKGGEASFIGKFGDNHLDIYLLIGYTNCNITFKSSNLIKCDAVAGTGVYSVTLYQNGVLFIGKDKYQYRPENQSCLNNCNSDKQQGTCDTLTGECHCLKGYSGYDCSNAPIGGSPQTNSTIDPNTGGTDFTNEQTNFQVYLKYLHELDFNGNKIKSFSLNDKWTLNNTDNGIGGNNNNIYKLEQMLNIDLISNKSDTVIGCKVTSIIEEINDINGKEITFGDKTFKIDNGSIKYSILISNYTYTSFLNTLQLELVSTVSDLNQQRQSNCNSKDIEIDSSDLSNFNYIKISKNNKILSGRFINTLISDGTPTFFKTTTTKQSNSVIISLNLPHFSRDCLIDPDFTVLVSSDFKKSCYSSDDRKWVIPVAVVVSVVGAATLITFSILLIKKNTTAKIIAKKLKRLNKD